jgi:outer membrane protein assembly factor BamD
VKSDGTVNLRAARSEGSFFNRATLGIFGKEAKTVTDTDAQSDTPETEKRSITNRISFGLLDRPKTAE